ncbi:MAG: 30S ribosome-binding factor RbfA [Chromatiaceae bacterium]|nr:30S ribosome-binding factor RbfA [Gammaproteobacteria bacterium]MCP5448934.1 30S ribosome-binding factor RbfA [Chromatiaceae bacterium]MCB1861963.1 30S ribosome-binding factor RbfA [Gammaproteobacteria bacterium]MCB1870707.1 30S ribosome-binding factor RbfA [Gammaproteobacteria bacterium]MCB1879347.1 30S ribosome-binding factor RbfA [Gammaproteobacteria bacterium]
MAREFKRTDRVGAQMQRELAALVRGELDDPRLGLITIQAVRVVRDFSHATIFFTVMAGELGKIETARVLNDAAPYLRHELGRRMKLRTLPELRFVHDESVEQGERLSSLIEQAVKSDSDKHKV